MDVSFRTANGNTEHFSDVLTLNHISTHTYEIIQRLGMKGYSGQIQKTRIVDVIKLVVNSGCICHNR